MGALFGFGKGVAYCLLVTMFAMTLLGPKKQQAICESRSGYYISKILAGADGILPKEIDQVIGPHLARLEQKLEDGREGKFTDSPLNTDSWNLGGLIDSTKISLAQPRAIRQTRSVFRIRTPGEPIPGANKLRHRFQRPEPHCDHNRSTQPKASTHQEPALAPQLHNLAIRPINSEIRHSRFNPTIWQSGIDLAEHSPANAAASSRILRWPRGDAADQSGRLPAIDGQPEIRGRRSMGGTPLNVSEERDRSRSTNPTRQRGPL